MVVFLLLQELDAAAAAAARLRHLLHLHLHQHLLAFGRLRPRRRRSGPTCSGGAPGLGLGLGLGLLRCLRGRLRRSVVAAFAAAVDLLRRLHRLADAASPFLRLVRASREHSPAHDLLDPWTASGSAPHGAAASASGTGDADLDARRQHQRHHQASSAPLPREELRRFYRRRHRQRLPSETCAEVESRKALLQKLASNLL